MAKGFWASVAILGLFGIGLDVAAVHSIHATWRFLATANRAEGKVVRLNESHGQDKEGRRSVSYAPVFEFSTPDQRKYSVESTTYSRPSVYSTGQSVPVLYSAENPQDAKLDGFLDLWLANMILGIFGFFCTMAFGGLGFFALRRAKLNDWLNRNGATVMAKVTHIGLNRSIRVNGRSPWQILCSWTHPDLRITHEFKSDYLWVDPSPLFADRTEIAVRIDPQNPSRYRVETAAMPEKKAA